MDNRHLKKVLVLALLAASLNGYAIQEDKDRLVQQCRNLAESLFTLVASQGRSSCLEKLGTASAELESAGQWIIKANNASAKQELENAIQALHYAQLDNCKRYIDITHSKYTAQKIRSYLQ
jgi:hypothetical protein